MIKFFRKIRYNLLKENNMGKYFKYAIGEILLVVIGILIALQINNWNEQRKHDLAEQEFFKGIANDLKQDLKFINYVQVYTQPKIDVYNTLNTNYPKDYISNKVKIDSLLRIYLTEGQRTFYPVSGSFSSALAGNEINTYRQKDLIQAIIKLYGSYYERLIDNGKIVDNRWDKLSEKYIHNRRTQSFSNINDSSYVNMLDDFHYHYVQLNWYRTILNETELEIKAMLQKLE